MLGAVICYQVYSQYATLRGSITEVIHQLSPNKLLALAMVVLLMPANWLMESIKWRSLLPRPPNHWATYRAVLLGNSVGLATPANIGDYAGRLSALDKDQYSHGLAATLLSSISQNIINIVVGCIGAAYLVVELEYTSPQTAWRCIAVASASILTVCAVSYTQIDRLDQAFKQLEARYPLLASITALRHHYRWHHLREALGYSCIRYIIYSTQYLLMIYVVGIQLSTIIAVAGIATIYLVQSGLPLPPMLGLLARGETAIIVWGAATDGAIVPILIASFGLWIINRAAASVGGLAFWYTIR